jgi:hypothetical protein
MDLCRAYLGRYAHRTALTDKAIVACDEHTVSVAYRDSRDHQRKRVSLPAQESAKTLARVLFRSLSERELTQGMTDNEWNWRACARSRRSRVSSYC